MVYIVKINIQQLLLDHSAKKHTRKHYSSNNYLFILHLYWLLIDVKSKSSMEKSDNYESKFPWLSDLSLWCHHVFCLEIYNYNCTPIADFVIIGIFKHRPYTFIVPQ